MYSEMIFKRGFIHCDPHPGNVLVRKGPKGGAEIIMLDHGLYRVGDSSSAVRVLVASHMSGVWFSMIGDLLCQREDRETNVALLSRIIRAYM